MHIHMRTAQRVLLFRQHFVAMLVMLLVLPCTCWRACSTAALRFSYECSNKAETAQFGFVRHIVCTVQLFLHAACCSLACKIETSAETVAMSWYYMNLHPHVHPFMACIGHFSL